MAELNLVNVISLNARTAVLSSTTTPTTIVSNLIDSGTVVKINTLIATNKTTGATLAAVDVYVDLYRSGNANAIASGVTVPAKALTVLLGKDTPLYLQEGDYLRVSSSVAGAIAFTASYDVLA